MRKKRIKKEDVKVLNLEPEYALAKICKIKPIETQLSKKDYKKYIMAHHTCVGIEMIIIDEATIRINEAKKFFQNNV